MKACKAFLHLRHQSAQVSKHIDTGEVTCYLKLAKTRKQGFYYI